MATFIKFQQYVEDAHHAVHNFSTAQLKVALSNTAPDAATDAVLADITQIAAGNGYPAGGVSVTTTSSGQTGGLYKLVIADPVITASGGDIAAFQYVTLYNSTAAGGPLIGYWDYGSSQVIPSGEALTVDASATNGVLQAS